MAGEDTTHRLGWLGTGRMGSELARRLLAADCDVAVYNRTKAKAEPLAAYGAKIANSAAELADRDIAVGREQAPGQFRAHSAGAEPAKAVRRVLPCHAFS